MKRIKKCSCAFLALAMALTLAACGEKEAAAAPSPESTPAASSSASPETGHYPVTVTNVNFKKEAVDFTYEKAPERVITFWTNSLETMLALGLGDRVVCAVGMNEDEVLPELQEELQKMKEGAQFATDRVNSNTALTKESAVMLEPDFILAWKSSFSDNAMGDVDYWNQRGVGTYIALNSNDVSEDRTLENEYEDMLTIGRIFGVEDRAQALVDGMKAEVERVTAAAKDEPKKTVLVIEYLSDKMWSYGSTFLAGNMVEAMGGQLLDAPRDIGKEDVINLNPEVLFVIGDGEEAVKQVTEDPAMASLQAVQSGSVYNLPLSYVYTSGVRTLYGLNAIGRGLYPGLYQ